MIGEGGSSNGEEQGIVQQFAVQTVDSVTIY